MGDFLLNAKKLLNRKSIKYALPFFTVIIGGSFAFRQFTNLRYEYSVKRFITKEEAEELEMKKPGEVTLESEYEKIKKLDIDNWQNIRIPRPYDENVVN